MQEYWKSFSTRIHNVLTLSKILKIGGTMNVRLNLGTIGFQNQLVTGYHSKKLLKRPRDCFSMTK